MMEEDGGSDIRYIQRYRMWLRGESVEEVRSRVEYLR
jgi:hypothetical protein